ncbi:oxygen-regulated protein 1-like [Seriola lalandi dorsalis]|nr:oxygen-regulated protein 1-like [Seriola lalandi dorsalis]
MSSTSIQDPIAQRLSSGSGQTLPSRPLQPISDPSASKRVCFYKSGDYKFSGHRMVINARTFKTFEALLDALSKKVPLPFGVRTITTPRGTHLVRGLDDLQDGGSYVCSDRKRVKPLNLVEVNRRQVPWNTTRPLSAGRRKRQGSQFVQFGRRNEVRPAKVTERAAVRTPKRLVVIKNRDPTVKRTIVLQKRTAPTFDSLLDYLSQILQFPVLKLYSTDGRRVDGLAALILCSGVVVAAGNEPFRLANYSFHRTGQMAQAMYMETMEPSMLLPRAQNNKSFSSGRGSRNFSSSSERYIVNQINKSRNGMNSQLHHHNGSFETEVNQSHASLETCGSGRADDEQQTSIVPQDDDIEKSFRVNQDGSMTVEMKVRLTIKEEEMLHWTTTLSRSSLSKRTACASISESGNSSPDSNNAIAKDSSSISEDETKEENHPTGAGKGVGFNDEQVCDGYTSKALGKAKTSFKRTPTPGPRHVKKKASVESVKMVTESGVQESTLGHYSYMERTADGETTEGYCVVRHSSSSNRPIPKPRKTASAEASNKGSHSSIRSSGVAEVLQLQNNGIEITETVMHIYESQGCFDNYLANDEYSADGVPLQGSTPAADSKPSTESGLRSSSNDCDIDFSCPPSTADPLQRQREEMLSLSSEPISLTHEKNKEVIKPDRNSKSSTSTSSSDKKLNECIISPPKKSKHSSTDKLSNASMGKKSSSSLESAKSGQKGKRKEKKAEKSLSKKSIKDEKTPKKDSALLGSTENVKRTPPKRQSTNKVTAKDNGHNVNTPTGRPQLKKNMSDILQPKKSLLPGRKTVSKPSSITENKIPSPKTSLELSESVSMPSLNPTPSDIHQYVENWLENASQDQVPYTESIPDESEPRSKVVFKIGGDSESDEMSECQNNLNEYYPLPGDAIKKSTSCLSVPLYHEGPETTVPYNEQKTRGLCVSMPSVRVDSVHEENTLRAHKSAEAIGPNESESTSSNILSPTAKLKPVLRQLCSSIQCIRRPSDTNTPSNLEKSTSLPDFSTQVASVFGTPCKAFLSFLSVMTLRDSLTGSALGDSNQSRSTSEAMLMMESLQKISAIDDEEEQRASLTDLQSRASSQFRERWKDFQILRERLESEPLSPKVSETEFALDVLSDGGDVFEDQHLGIDELLEELNMPQDLRAEISSTIQQTRSFYPVEESTFIETDRNQSESEEDVEKFVDECNDETKQSTDPDATCVVEDITGKNKDNDDGDTGDLNKMQSMHSEQVKMMGESEQEVDDVEETGVDVKGSEADEALEVKENETEEKEDEDQVEEIEEDREGEKDREGGETKEINDDGEELENMEEEKEEEKEEEAVKEDDEGQEEWEAEKGNGGESVEKVEEGTEEEMTTDEKDKLEGEKEVVKETEEGFMNEEHQEAREDDNVEETDEREIVQETVEEEEGKDEVEEEVTGEEEKGEEEEEEEEEGEKEEVVTESNVGEEVDEFIEEGEEGEEGEIIDEAEEKEVDVVNENDVEEEVEEDNEDTVEVENIVDEVEENEEEEVDVVTENDVEEEVEEDNEDTVEVENIVDEVEENEEEEVDVVTENDVEEEVEEDVEETEEEEEVQDFKDEMEEREEEDVDLVIENDVEEEVEEVIEETEEEEEVQDFKDEMEEREEEEVDEVIENDVEEEVEEVIEETEEEEEVEDFKDEMEEREQEEVDVVIENDVEEEVEVIEETDEEKEEENIIDKVEEKEEEVEMITENDGEDEVEDIIEDTDEEEEVKNIDEVEEKEKEEVDVVSENDVEEEVEDVIEETEEEAQEEVIEEEEEEEENIIDQMEEDEEEEVDVVTENDVEEDAREMIEETDEEEEAENIREDLDVEEEEEEEMDVVIEERNEKEDITEVVSEENNEEEERDGDAEVIDTEERTRVITDEEEEEEEEETDKDTEEEEEGYGGSRKELENVEDSQEEKSVEEEEAEELETEENMKAGHTLEEEEREDNDEENELNEELDQVEEQESNDEIEEDVDNSADDKNCKNLLEEASYLQQHCSSHDEANAELNTESPTKYSSEGQCEFDKGNGTDTADELETDVAGECHEERSNSQPHPVEISQQLLDFVNSALQSSSLTFTYDARGNIRIEPDNARVVQTNQTVIPKTREDSSYGLKRLPSPSTSDLTDYRPETSESGGYKTQESVDVVTESGEEALERPFPVYRRKTHIPNGRTNVETAVSKVTVASNSEVLQSSRLKSTDSFSSFDSGTKASREDLSYFSATSSLKADAEAAPEAAQCVSFTSGKKTTDGVLIDRGRWLLKENHLIRKSPPVSLGMYGNLDSTSIDTGQENDSEDSLPHYKTQHNPLVAISSSELEEMAKPQTPKCTYYNMPHGSDSDPFFDDSSIHSGKKDTSSVKGRYFRVSPTIDTSKTWSNKNGSLSSFASVEFKIPDRKVHPEGESSAVTNARRTPSGGGRALQAQDSLDTIRVRCGQYCPIL